MGVVIPHTCGWCGAVFMAYRSSGRKDCCHDCYSEAREGISATWNLKPPIVQACGWCGKEFQKGRDTGRSAQLQFCSAECAGRAKYAHPTVCLALSPTEAAYLAGFVDGEGCIILYRAALTVRLRVVIVNTHRAVIDWGSVKTGVGSVGPRSPYNGRAKLQWQWQINQWAAESFLLPILPYLIVKREQALLALDFTKRLRVPELKHDYAWQYEYQGRMRALNKRGPATVA